MRINARLDEEHAAKLDYLLEASRQKVTDVVKHGIDLYYDEIKRREGEGARRILQSSFIGCAEGDEKLSAHYKELLSEGIGEKHGHR